MPLNFDPFDPKQFARLRKVLEYNYREMTPFRDVRELNKVAARGHLYRLNKPDNAEREPVNMMDQWLQTLVRSFVQTNPRARVTSREQPRIGRIFEEYLNRQIVELKLVDTLRRCVQESLLGYMGIGYCGIDSAGAAFCDPIPLPDFVLDLAHDEFHQADIMGHRFVRRIGELRGNNRYDQEIVAQLHRRKSSTSTLDDRRPGDDYDEDQGSLFDWADIWQILVQPANLVVYLSLQSEIDKPLRVEAYDGPEFGPYTFLAFDRVLDEMMPNSRGAMVLDMHKFVSSQYTRVFMKEDQAADFYTYEGGAEEDARAVRDAQDGELKQVNSNNAVKRRTKPGTNPQALGTAIHGRQLFDEMSGNIRRTGGVAASADTATEARIDSANTSRLMRDMQLQVVAFTKSLLQNIAWVEWTHSTRSWQVERKIGTGGMAVHDILTPEQREGDFIQHEIDIVPDSMEHRSSRQQADELMQAVQGLVIPAMQLPSERPVVLDAPKLVHIYSRLRNLPELDEVTGYAADDSYVSRPEGGAPRLPAGATPGGGNAGPGRGGPAPEDAMLQRALTAAPAGAQGDED